MFNGEKLGAFIIPTGVGACIGGFAGDASPYARKLSEKCRLIVNPNVVNAGGFSGINDKMFYVEGFSLDEFFKGKIKLKPSVNNRIGVIFDRAIPEHIINVHINTINAVKAVYGIDIPFWEICSKNVGVNFKIDENGISNGSIENPETIINSGKSLLDKGCDALAIVCMFENPEIDNLEYSSGAGVDPVGGVEAIISHLISKELRVPCAHSPAFDDLEVTTKIVDSKAASEYITPTFLPCILLGLNNAPLLSTRDGIGIENLDFLIMPYNSLGSTPVFECVKREIPIYAVKENSTVLDVTAERLGLNGITQIEKYDNLYVNLPDCTR